MHVRFALAAGAVVALAQAPLSLGCRAEAGDATPAPEARPGAPQSAPSSAATPPRRPRARPAHLAPVAVAVSGAAGTSNVWIDATETTVAAFKTCVDKGACKKSDFEVQTASTCNYGEAGHEDHPMNCVNYYGADAYCGFAGGRLCKEEEWFAGCRGPQNQDYPYGTAYRADACNALARSGPIAERGTASVAEYAGCEGGYPGIYDMVGNVSEWLDSCKGDYCHFYGGAFLENDPVEDFASCKRFCAGNQKPFRSSTIGFRCCYDKEPKSAGR